MLLLVAHLAELHLVVSSGYQVITGLPPMGVVTGYAGDLAPLAPIRGICLAGERMPAPIAHGQDMNSFADLLVTGEAEPVHRLQQLVRILAGVRIMAYLAHFSGNRSMEKLERFMLGLFFHMAVVTETGILLDRDIFGS